MLAVTSPSPTCSSPSSPSSAHTYTHTPIHTHTMDAERNLIQKLDIVVNSLETQFMGLFETPLVELLPRLSAVEKAELQINFGYLLNSLFYIHLKLEGLDPKNHECKKELDRVKTYFEKLKTAQGKNKPGMVIDASAAKRFVLSGLQGNDEIKGSCFLGLLEVDTNDSHQKQAS